MTDLGLERTLTKLKKLSTEPEHWAAVQERMDEASLYFDKSDVWNEGLEKGLAQGIEKGIVQGIKKGRAEERLKAEATWRQVIHLLISLPNFASASAAEIAAHTGIEADFVRTVLAESAAKTAKPT